MKKTKPRTKTKIKPKECSKCGQGIIDPTPVYCAGPWRMPPYNMGNQNPCGHGLHNEHLLYSCTICGYSENGPCKGQKETDQSTGSPWFPPFLSNTLVS